MLQRVCGDQETSCASYFSQVLKCGSKGFHLLSHLSSLGTGFSVKVTCKSVVDAFKSMTKVNIGNTVAASCKRLPVVLLGGSL